MADEKVREGDPAPGFDLPGTDGTPEGRRRYRLADHRSRSLILLFYPGDDTPVCTAQLTAYTEGFPDFGRVGADVLAVSPQGVDSHERFASKHGGFAFPLLADEDKAVGRSYGVVGPLGFYRRSAFVIDGDGIIRWAWRSLTGVRYPAVHDLTRVLEEDGSGT